jgi:transcriptional regulator with XRE-family HTH domain
MEDQMVLIGENMNLKEYLYLKKVTIKDLSELLDYSRPHLSGVVNGKLKPSRKLARAIQKYTNGEVTMEEIFKTYGK